MILAVLQARTSSSRLPGKVLQDLAGRPMLARQCERILRATRIDRLVIATSEEESDAPVAVLAEELGIACYRGSLQDVLGRFHGAATEYSATHVVRLTGDCPLTDPQLIDHVIDAHIDGGFDFTSNALDRTYPKGLDAEACTRAALGVAAREATTRAEREHVTPFFYTHPERFRIGSVRQAEDHSALCWCVDEPEDLEFVRTVYGRLLPTNPAFTTSEVMDLLAREPTLAHYNPPTSP